MEVGVLRVGWEVSFCLSAQRLVVKSVGEGMRLVGGVKFAREIARGTTMLTFGTIAFDGQLAWRSQKKITVIRLPTGLH